MEVKITLICSLSWPVYLKSLWLTFKGVKYVILSILTQELTFFLSTYPSFGDNVARVRTGSSLVEGDQQTGRPKSPSMECCHTRAVHFLV